MQPSVTFTSSDSACDYDVRKISSCSYSVSTFFNYELSCIVLFSDFLCTIENRNLPNLFLLGNHPMLCSVSVHMLIYHILLKDHGFPHWFLFRYKTTHFSYDLFLFFCITRIENSKRRAQGTRQSLCYICSNNTTIYCKLPHRFVLRRNLDLYAKLYTLTTFVSLLALEFMKYA
ncbi:hypothetical protein ABZP36_009651 [Zizania latifolia]